MSCSSRPPKIIRFRLDNTKFNVLSSYFPCPVIFDGVLYQSAEAAWQAQKTFGLSGVQLISTLAAKQAHSVGQSLKLRPDWESIKFDLLIQVQMAKFTQNPKLADILCNTGDAILLENTTGYHDNEYGECSCPDCRKGIMGENKMGKALMIVRDNIKIFHLKRG